MTPRLPPNTQNHPPKGRITKENPSPRVSITFDKETFDQINKIAIVSNQSFAQTVRELVEWGLDSF